MKTIPEIGKKHKSYQKQLKSIILSKILNAFEYTIIKLKLMVKQHHKLTI